MTASGLAVVLVCVTMVVSEVASLRRGAVENMSTHAGVIATHSTAALLFEDAEAGRETLEALDAVPGVVRASLYSADGSFFAEFLREDDDPYGLDLEPPGTRFDRRMLVLSHPVNEEGEVIGTLMIAYDTSHEYAQLATQNLLVICSGAIAIMAALILSTRLQRVLMKPINELAGTATRVSNERDFTTRATKYSDDELGRLTDAFNEMLVHVQEHEIALQDSHSVLERRVEERTEELAGARDEALQSLEREQAAVVELSYQKYALDQHTIVSITDTAGRIIYANDNFCKISGYSRQELIGRNHRIIKSDEHDSTFYRNLWDTILKGEVWSGEVRSRAKDGTLYWFDSTIVPFKDDSGQITQYVGIRTDVTERRDAEEKLRKYNAELEIAATTDKLTGLPNRAVFLDRLDQRIKMSRRDGSRFAVLFFDFDRFKVVNDSLGHDMGDALLCDIAKLFRSEMRDSDTVARFGGDEFVVLLNNLAKWSDAQSRAERLLETFAAPHQLGDHLIVSTASIGLVTNERVYMYSGDMIRDADAAMYQAKELGRAKVVVFDEAMQADAMARLSMEADLRRALHKKQFHLVYQPIVELCTGNLTGFEALLRWDHPEHGDISPVEFIPIAEDTGLILDIGQWVFEEAARQAVDWNRGLSPNQLLRVNVNVSKRQLLDPSFIEMIKTCRDEVGLRPAELQLEITESTIADDRSNVAALLHEIRELGFRIAIDDFGTGVSSLSALHEFPIDVLKIDQAFIRVLSLDRSLVAIVASIANLAQNLGIDTVAEGVETAEIVGVLQSIGCTWGQGYFFSKPLPVQEAEALLIAERKKFGPQAA